jgi:hypothetical protein
MQYGSSLAYESNQFKGNNLLKPIYEKKILVILNVGKKWFCYIIGSHFKVKKYHDNLKYLLER